MKYCIEADETFLGMTGISGSRDSIVRSKGGSCWVIMKDGSIRSLQEHMIELRSIYSTRDAGETQPRYIQEIGSNLSDCAQAALTSNNHVVRSGLQGLDLPGTLVKQVP